MRGRRPRRARPARAARRTASSAATPARPAIISEKKTPIDSAMPEFWKVDAHARGRAARFRAGTLLMIDEVFGAANRPAPMPLKKMMQRERRVAGSPPAAAAARRRRSAATSSPPAGEQPRAVPVGQVPGDRPGDQEADGQRQQVDAGPQRRVREVVAVQRQPDALQPDDQHELQAAAGDRAEQAGRVAGGEGPDAEQARAGTSARRPCVSITQKTSQQRHAADQARQDQRVRPAHRVAAVGLDAVGDRGEQRGQARRRR